MLPTPQPLRYRDWPQVAALALHSLSDLQARTLRYYLCHHSNGFHVLREGRRVLGLSFVQRQPGCDELWLTMIAVDGHERRHGLGSQLLRHVETQARGMGLPRVGLRCRQDNAQALLMYERHGYAVTGESRHPRTGAPVHVLHKVLPASVSTRPLLAPEVPRWRCWLNRAIHLGLFGLRV